MTPQACIMSSAFQFNKENLYFLKAITDLAPISCNLNSWQSKTFLYFAIVNPRIICGQNLSLMGDLKIIHTVWGVAKMAKEEDPELTSSYRHTKITTVYRPIIDENSLKNSGKDLLQ